MQTSQFFAISAMDVEHIDAYTPGTVVNFKRSEGTVLLAKILGPSERGAEYRSITYERSGSMVTHSTDVSPLTPTTCHTSLNCQLVGNLRRWCSRDLAKNRSLPVCHSGVFFCFLFLYFLRI